MRHQEAHLRTLQAPPQVGVEHRRELMEELQQAVLAVDRARKADMTEFWPCYESVCAAYSRCLQHMDAVSPFAADAQLLALWHGVDRIGAWIASVQPLVRDYYK